MDFIMDYRLIYCMRNGLPLDMDVYDLAEWSVIGDLTRLSLEHQSAPVPSPTSLVELGSVSRAFKLHFAK